MPCDFRLEVFITLCRTGSFTKAAEDLGVSQPAVSQNIAELEKELGVKLFSRSRGEVSLTPDGNLFRNYAEKILYWYESASSAFRSVKDAPQRMSVFCSPDLSHFILPELFSVLRRSFPDLAVVSMSSVTDMPSVNDQEGNVLCLYSSVVGVSGTGAVLPEGDMHLADCRPVAAVSPMSRHIRDFTAVSKRADYAAWPHLAVLSAGSSSRTLSGSISGPVAFSSECPVESELAAAGLSGKIVFVSDSADAVKHIAVKDPETAAVLPPYCVHEELTEGRLVQLPSSWLDFRYSVIMRASESLRQLHVFGDIVRVVKQLLQSWPGQQLER